MPAQRTKDTLFEAVQDASTTTMSIIAPTPRAFTFPPAHNLSDSPYSSPSNSPFEPDLRPSLPSIPQSSSPDSITIPTPPPTVTRHRRRTSSSDAERRPKKGDEDYVKRPENAFILFRRKCVDDREAAAAEAGEPLKKMRQADLSKMISQQWKSLSPEDRQYWENLAKEKKREHEQLHPDYVYRPTRTKKSTTRAARRRAAQAALREGQVPLLAEDTMSFILPIPQQAGASRQHGRSASAPTPPPYQSFNIPNVFAGTPGSCPTSPSLMPLIAARRGGSADMFDYVPPSQASYASMAYESNDLMRSMYSQQQLPQPLSVPSTSTDSSSVPMCSPASSVASTSSGPSSPDAVYTPTSALVPQPYLPSQYDAVTCEALSQADLHEQQLQLQQQDWDLAGYAWDTTSIWGPSDLLIAEDFDINSIPPIELGVPNKLFDQQMIMGGQPEFLEQSHDHYAEQSSPLSGSLVGFDEMVSSNRTF